FIMAKFTVEVELDWLHEGDNIDEVIREEVIAGLQNTITRNVEKEIQNKMTERINEEVGRVVDSYLENIAASTITEIEIPTKEDHWSSEVEMVPISEYIGKQFKNMTTE